MFNFTASTFTKSSVSRLSKREGHLYKWGSDYDLRYNYSGYANFRYTEFYNESDFYGSKFDGLALFNDTKFFGISNFVRTEFKVQKGMSPLDNAYFHSTLFDKYMRVEDESIGYG